MQWLQALEMMLMAPGIDRQATTAMVIIAVFGLEVELRALKSLIDRFWRKAAVPRHVCYGGKGDLPVARLDF